MTVLYVHKTLGRSYRQSLWRCGLSSERYLGGYPSARTGVLVAPLFHVHSFSTSSNTDGLKTDYVTKTSTRTTNTPQKVLQVASSEARRLMAKAPKSSSSSSSSPKDAMEAARAILALTSPTKPLAEAIMQDKSGNEQVACLHHALIAVTSWCISLIPLDESLMDSSMDLARRAHDLSLPLHLPLYRSLVTAIAQHSKDKGNAVASILETANLAVSALSVTLQGSFFFDALLALVEQQHIQQAVVLRRTMEERYDIDTMDIKASIEISMALQKSIQAYIKDRVEGSRDLGQEDAIIELSSMIRKSMDGIKSQLRRQSRMSSISDMIAEENDEQALEDALQELEDLYDSSDEASSDDSDMEEDCIASAQQLLNDIEQMEEDFNASLEDFIRKAKEIRSECGVSVQLRLNAETGDIESFHISPSKEAKANTKDDEEDETDTMTKDMIYLRDSKSWVLPDVTPQLVKLNGGRNVFYTRQYEDQIMQEVIDNFGDGGY